MSRLALLRFPARWVYEILDFCIIFLTVFILGVFTMYFNIFWVEIESYFGGAAQKTQLVHDLATTTLASSSTQGTQENLAQDAKKLTQLQGNYQEVTTEHFYEYLTYRARSYDLAFNKLPPGKRLIIDSIGVDTPIVDVPYASNEKLEQGDFEEELREGVVKYPFTSQPGQKGTTLLFGHSSIDAWKKKENPYGQVFAKLGKLNEGDLIKVIWDGKLHIYEAVGKEVKWPKDVGDAIAAQGNEEHLLTLMACYPLLSDAQRMLVKARPWKPQQLSVVPSTDERASN